MLDEKDLQAIAKLIQASEERTNAKLSEMEERITRNAVAMMEAYFDPKFNALYEKLTTM